jgi:Zn-dependent M28 family amino/carboxypeptidase
MQWVFGLMLAATLGCGAATQTPSSGFDSQRAYAHMRDLVEIGPRVSGTPANRKTRQYITSALASMGIKAVEQPFEGRTPLGTVAMANVIATLPGSRSERIILASHFDTKLFRDFTFVGANDGGSSTGALLELARVLKDRPRTFTIELLFFDGEEAVVEWGPNDSTYGSRHYVQAARAANTLSTIKAVVLLDMIGDTQLNIRRESQSAPWLTDIVWTAARRLGYQRHFLAESTPVEDDHLPFLQAGVPAVDIIDLDYAAWHTAADTLEHVSAKSLQIVGDVVLAALPEIERRLTGQ